ncbi:MULTISPECIES: PTS system mannose/fructose/sorbose family transporter subunit IID [Enterococcaceae]|uniref:PTS mannose transporter subunit IID n=1 Tax=Vagococcus vulneris TaxID=1977869 RepID=A0A430A2C0_9ENTE|nr:MULTISPECIES: PTS system mannose/fructose/sorbose family transporter subunit IID [Enterococcaceae]BBM18412.1 PTS mannose transporter subunit IID [Enterococcus avium]EJE4563036.1 PTS system mannose/fructose/sorbose family transporter subunit IID [Enterococcus faecium]EJX51236.1 putative mannose permease IID component [Enterococcus faecium R497]EKY7882982.1 PTS system mannose/fructose/sorbose family transporter subunit IID [Enterococcus faecium]EKZ0059226.1 PTS system mannose/fructose/sorbose
MNNSENLMDKQTFRKMFLRSFLLQGTWNYINGAGIGACYMMIPFIKKLYPNPEDKEKRTAALKRGMGYFNITPAVAPFPLSIASRMEEENKVTTEFDPNSINAVKASLMGPLSGIGDSLFWGTIRVIAAGIGISLAETGNVLGPIIFLILYNIPNILTRWYGLKLGYNLGGDFIKKAYENGMIAILTKSAGILGMVMVGAMIFTTVTVTTPLKFQMGEMTFKLQEVLDQIMLGILPLGITLGCFTLIRKKVSPNKIIVLMVILSFVLSALKIV